MHFGKEVGEALTLKFAQAANEMKAQGKSIISLGLGEPDFKTPDYVVEATVQAMRNGFTHYSPVQGLPELRCHIADAARLEYGADYDFNQVIITPGIKAAVYFALCALLEPGDEVILLSPYYVSYPAMIRLAEPQATIRTVCLSKSYTLDIDALKAAISPRTKCILLNSPQNPTGMMLSRFEVETIISLALQNNFYIISDEVYDKLVFSTQHHVSFGCYPEVKEKLVICNGYSKSFAMTGWRLGYAIGARSIISKMNKLQQHINTNTCTFIQKGACAIYEHTPIHIKPYVDELEKRMQVFHNGVSSLPCISGNLPHAGFFYFADISKTGMDSNSFCVDLLNKTGIASTPGVAFGADWDDHVRFSLAVPMELLNHSIELMRTYFEH